MTNSEQSILEFVNSLDISDNEKEIERHFMVMNYQDTFVVRTINKKKYLLWICDTVKSSSESRYYKIKEVKAFQFGNKNYKKFIVSSAGYAGEYGSIRAGILDKFGDK